MIPGEGGGLFTFFSFNETFFSFLRILPCFEILNTIHLSLKDPKTKIFLFWRKLFQNKLQGKGSDILLNNFVRKYAFFFFLRSKLYEFFILNQNLFQKQYHVFHYRTYPEFKTLRVFEIKHTFPFLSIIHNLKQNSLS